MRSTLNLVAVAALLSASTQAVKHEDFKKCHDAAFCRRGRALAARALEAGPSQWQSPYSLDKTALSFSNAAKSAFTIPVKSSIHPNVKFTLQVLVHEDGVVRVRMDEVYETDSKWRRYDEAAQWALIREPTLASHVDWKVGKNDIRTTYKGAEVRITYEPLKISVLRDGKEDIVLNGDGLLHMEHFREKPAKVEKVEESESVPSEAIGGAEQVALQPEEPQKLSAGFEGEDEDGYWEETWKGWTDSKPKGAIQRDCG